MKAAILERYGKGSALRVGEVAAPGLGPDDVMLQVHAAGVNMIDVKIRDGEFRQVLPYPLPCVLGFDVAGVVAQVGENVRRFAPGDAVYASVRRERVGAFAERIAVHADDVAAKPDALDMVAAASLPLVALTAWQALVDRAQLRPGQKVFIQAGSGGVGSIAIQLAKHLGAYVATTTSGPNVDWVRALGADEVLDYRTQDLASLGRDFDVVLHSLGAPELAASLGLLKPGGVLVSLSGPPDPQLARDLGKPWLVAQIMRALSFGVRRRARRLGVRYTFLFMHADGSALDRITPLVDAGVIRPVLDKVFTLEQVNEAMAHVASHRAKGKVVLRVGG